MPTHGTVVDGIDMDPAGMTARERATTRQRNAVFRAHTRRVGVLREQYRKALADLDRAGHRRGRGSLSPDRDGIDRRPQGPQAPDGGRDPHSGRSAPTVSK